MMFCLGMGGNESFVRRKRSGRWEDVLLGEGRFLIVCTKETERKMGGCGAFVRRKRSGGWEVTNRLYEGNGAEDVRLLIVCTKVTERRMGG